MQASTEKRGTTGIIRVDNPPVNAISHGVRTGIMDGLRTLIEDSEISAIVLACEGRTWMAGADITEFGKPMAEPLLTDVVKALDECPKPVVAALFGTAFGGGLEVALACNYRVATKNARIGMPEVKLGLIPGAGGTQRLPRAGDLDLALNAIVSGNPVPAPVAAASGVIDRIVEGDLVDAAVQFAQDRVADGSPLKRLSDVTLDPQQYDAAYFAAFRKSIARRTRGMTAPERGIQAVEAAVNLPFEDGVARERELFMQCHADPQSKAMQHVFFAERQAARIPGLGKDVSQRPVRQVAVIGAGTMGGGIAMNFANAGIPVSLLEISQEALDRGVGVIARNYENSARKGRLSDQQVKERMALITPVVDYDRLADADLVIEAVFETMDIKKTVFAELDRVTRDDAILATNTSYLDINEIADGVSHPERVLGMHFFSPANVMRLLEIVRAEKTAPDVLSTVLKLSRTIGKVGVVAGVCHGFIGNRMLGGYSREANLLVMEGADPQQVDRVLVAFGMPMGLLAMGDLAGLDVGYRNRQGLDPSQYDARAVYLSDRLVEMGRLGQKTSAGIYDYAEGDRTPIPSPITAQIIEEGREKFAIEPREISEREIIQRCFYSLFNSGCNVLHEGIAYRASDIDIVYINGYGFPAWRGGPMFWGEHSEGLATILETIQAFASIHGDRWWQPSPLLQRLVEEGGSLRDVVNA